MPETIPLCACRIVGAERQENQVVLKVVCPVEQAPAAAGEGEAGGEAAHEQRTRLLRQAAKPLPDGEVLLNR